MNFLQVGIGVSVYFSKLPLFLLLLATNDVQVQKKGDQGETL